MDEVFSGVKPLRSIAAEEVANNHTGHVLTSLLGRGKYSLVLFDSGYGDAYGLGG